MSRPAFWRIALVACCAACASGVDAQQPVADARATAYEAACVAARSGQVAAAEDHLRAALRAGFADWSAMQREPDLAPLRGRPVMTAILAARDAADDVLSQRRLDDWRQRLGVTRYAEAQDDGARVDLLLAGSFDQSAQDVLQSIRSVVNLLVPSLFPEPWRHRLLVVVLDEADATIFLPHANARGKYVHSERLLFVTDIGRSLQHELTHALHHAHMDSLGQQHPIWVQEGLASLFESAVTVHSAALAFEPNERDLIVQLLLEGERDVLPQFFSLDDIAFNRDAASHYALARSLMRFLHDRGALHQWYAQYCDRMATDPTGAEAFASALSMSPDEAEEQWRTWVYSNRVRGAQDAIIVSAPSTMKHQTEALETESTSDRPHGARDLYERIRPRLIHEYARAVPHLEEVIALDPDHAAAHYDLGLASVLAGALERAELERATLDRLDRNLASLLESAIRNRR